ncbi:N5,N10-methylenetetrahydromethanopterin reductase [[Actinomadura] parvosata subsp. kistnae]|uniref:LLM class F420-dependent oxidoreductase n=1 Tax=[Actinomadura] parvosata subsp. kistnae TaxID=1909395 RepID=A0A1V0A6Y4_9ACTN|nr:TIGR03619 family F420-dependent LLM class oxidoreductase [Nonomuraea sp. ATCC 55076]AQZ65961.1 LLM class F420-dependent oxidoreductase [Nonomuraea sp. ATCC 55076]SPL97420.1 N5,N10-methylenetetrahydromethanopterin reductase [Actinomadura parvosata subsp. kistnae]
MRLGVTMFATDLAMPVHELARALEERGFDSLYVPEHTHIPVSRRTPHPSGAELPEEYKRTLDPLVALSYAAAATRTLRVGTGILLAAQRDPVVTAKAIASLDHLSGGRVVVGVGFGWNVEEIENHGVPYRERREVARRNVLAMQALWRDEVASFDGFEPSWSWPKPVQVPPVYLGGAAGPKLFAHVAEYADGWMPIGGRGIKAALPALREACEKAGRPAAEVIPFATLPTREKLDYYASLGITQVVANLPSAPADVVLPLLDEYAALL